MQRKGKITMSEFDDFIRGISSDIKTAAEQVSKKTEEVYEISKRRAEKVKIKGRIQADYQKLGELVYGSIKNEENVDEEVAAIVGALDAEFERISEIYEEINAIKNGSYVPEEDEEDDEEDWEEEYAEGYDEDEEEETEEAVVLLEGESEETAEEEPAGMQEFNIDID